MKNLARQDMGKDNVLFLLSENNKIEMGIKEISRGTPSPFRTPLSRREFFPLNILFAKQDRFSLNGIIFEGVSGGGAP